MKITEKDFCRMSTCIQKFCFTLQSDLFIRCDYTKSNSHRHKRHSYNRSLVLEYDLYILKLTS